MTIPADERRISERLDVSDAGIGHRFGHFRHSVVRIAAFVMAMSVFFYAANVIDPGQTSALTGSQIASDGGPAVPPLDQHHADSTRPVSSGSLGSLTSLEYIVEIHATIEGPRYTVRDSEGRLLGAMLEAAEVEIVAPGLEIEGMFAEPLMLAEPRSNYPD